MNEPAPKDYNPISSIQGTGAASPLAGERASTRGIVTGDFQDGDANTQNNLGGFFLQSLAPDQDNRTSEGLFVFDRNAKGTDVGVGDIVTVSGSVEERFGETQLKADAVAIIGKGNATATELRLPAAGTVHNSDGTVVADLEHLEGMFLQVPQRLFVQDLAGLERYGEILLSTEERQFQFTEREQPDAAGYRKHRQRVAAQVLMLDDGRVVQNASPVRYIGDSGSAGRAPRLSDAAESLQGVLRYSRGSGPNGLETWRLMPTSAPRFVVRNPRPEPPAIDAPIIVASFNLLNYFSTIDSGKNRCGPALDQGCRGAESAREFKRQRQRTANAIEQSGASIVGVMELENNARASVEDLTAALAATGGEWRFIDTGTIGDDVIRVGIVYRPDRVSPFGDHAILDASVDKRFDDNRNRPALAQTFRSVDNGGKFTVAVNHLKSKGSPCDDDGDPNRGDGQGNCNQTRTQAALALADWLESDPTSSGDSDILIVGDLNAYSEEDPVRALREAGFRDLLRTRTGSETWSFAFRGESGALDHALASPALAAQVSEVVEWHINADESALYDYNLNFGRDPGLFDPDAVWRASDHDPLLVGLKLQPD
ncbi:MAG: ExeM/NucH family extracellular endonuclease [Woeseia sp.]|nr:ExeM/NucH family extracellular endonuclease [Woeseia sp.]MBT8095689.1 ExeM/NucH family extracellular endonuclease [Woeseia sp.]NNE61895.1 ExeM/NucH family extracellular endonuclease [Woeseia sp.]NNL55534.1 ExeM/NucH family extracellular endonuclease [Woeseia sp.]